MFSCSVTISVKLSKTNKADGILLFQTSMEVIPTEYTHLVKLQKNDREKQTEKRQVDGVETQRLVDGTNVGLKIHDGKVWMLSRSGCQALHTQGKEAPPMGTVCVECQPESI